MKRSSKASAVSIAAFSLPLAGFAAAATQMDSEPEVIVEAGTASVLAPESATEAQATEAQPTEAPIDPMRGWSEDDLDAYAAYWDAGYNYDQLLTLADEWNLSQFEAKARAGNAILAGDTSSFDSLVEGIEAQPVESPDLSVVPSQSYWDAGYDYDDAVVLAEAWNTTPYEAKVIAGDMIDDGDVAELVAILGQD